jgi:hypothetical protein
MEVDAKGLRLARNARFVSLEEVAARQIAHEGDLDVTLVERRRGARKTVSVAHARHGGQACPCNETENKAFKGSGANSG